MEMQSQEFCWVVMGAEQAERVYSVILLEKEFPALHDQLFQWYKRVEMEPFPVA